MEGAIAVVSDIHANLEALEAVLEDIEKQKRDYGITEIHSLGDIVGYGPNPVECTNKVREKVNSNLMGNHEEAACYLDNATINIVCKEKAAEPVRWIRNAIFRTDPEIFAYLRSLPYINFPDKDDLQRGVVEVHGTLCLEETAEETAMFQFTHPNPEQKKPFHDAVACASINYYSSAAKEQQPNLQKCFNSLNRLGKKVCFVGHTHYPELSQSILYTEDFVGVDLHFGTDFRNFGEACKNLEPDSNHVINPGSVGQPRDGDTRASYCIYTGDKVIFRRIPYDRRTTMLKLLAKSFLPDNAATYLAARLEDAR